MTLADITKFPAQTRSLYLRLVAHMAAVDGSLDESEVELLESMFTRFGISAAEHDQLVSKVQLSEAEIQSGFEELRQKKMQYSFLLDLISMAMADGLLHDAEKVYLAKINDLVGIPRADFHNLIYFAQAARNVEDPQNMDPMLGYIFDNFFRWARQDHITLYRETTFAPSVLVDQYLKDEL
ncbi:MAG: TerB family tellurite resistance protein [bacterium]|nr:TerB family tellurite resistance protein [bacterium]